jgi:hypothetical protein
MDYVVWIGAPDANICCFERPELVIIHAIRNSHHASFDRFVFSEALSARNERSLTEIFQ